MQRFINKKHLRNNRYLAFAVKRKHYAVAPDTGERATAPTNQSATLSISHLTRMSVNSMSKTKHKQRKQEYNLRNQQAAIVRKYVYSTSFRDRVIKEIVCTQTPDSINEFLRATLTPEQPQMYFPLNEPYTDGLVLVNQLTFEFSSSR